MDGWTDGRMDGWMDGWISMRPECGLRVAGWIALMYTTIEKCVSTYRFYEFLKNIKSSQIIEQIHSQHRYQASSESRLVLMITLSDAINNLFTFLFFKRHCVGHRLWSLAYRRLVDKQIDRWMDA